MAATRRVPRHPGGRPRRKGVHRSPPVPELIPVPPAEPTHLERKQRSPFIVGFLGAAGVLVAIALGQAMLTVQSVLILVVLAMFLALGLNPAVEFFTRRRVPRGFAVTIVALATLGVIALGVTALVPILTEQATALSRRLPVLLQNLAEHPQLREFEEQYQVVEKIQAFIASGSLINSLFGGVMGAGKLVANLVFSVIVTLVLTIYFLASLPTIKETIYALAPAAGGPAPGTWPTRSSAASPATSPACSSLSRWPRCAPSSS
nr:AI-2E family transporter [Tessaracoccus coleopterorum]